MIHLTEYIERWQDRRILVVGDVMLDSYTIVAPDGACPEDTDAPIWRILRQQFYAGGAANAAVNLASLGALPVVCGAIGNDLEGSELDEILEDHKVDARLVFTRGQSTTMKSRIFSAGKMIARVDRDQTLLNPDEDLALAAEIRNAIYLLNPDAILLSDYSKGVLDPKGEVVAVLADMNAQVDHIILDPRRSILDGHVAIDAITPNHREAMMIGGATGSRKRFFDLIPGLKAVVETRGSWGAVLHERGQPDFLVRTAAVDNPQVSGAGDSFAAALTLARVADASWHDAARIANAVARIAVSHTGTIAPSAHALRVALRKPIA